jgi:transcriptional regulator GlxA family with amidase domain
MGEFTNRRRVGILGFDDVTALDIIGPSDAFSSAMVDAHGRTHPPYKVLLIAVGRRRFVTESGLAFHAEATLADAPALDTLIVPGGRGLRAVGVNAVVSSWIKKRAPQIRRIVSVCTGIYGLAPTGLLDGRRVTTHWRFARDVAERFPKLDVRPNALFLRDGKFSTSAGVTTGIDLSLELIGEDCGPRVALAVARELVMFLKRPGDQEQYSEPLQFQTETIDQFQDLAGWMRSHLRNDLSVESLAARTNLCARHFARRFKAAFRTTPARFAEDLRLGEAQRRLSLTRGSVEVVATSVGYESADAFRRAFERRLHLSPSAYKARFATDDGRTSRRRPRA